MVRYSYTEYFRKTLCKILAAIVFGLENLTFWAKSDIFIPECEGGGGPPVKEISLKKYHFF